LFIYNVTRLDQLKVFLLEDPDDPFNHYALAMEHMSTDSELARKMLLAVIEKFPEYVPTYYQAANLSMLAEENELALLLIHQGKNKAALTADHKALAELNRLAQELEY
jgi:hypothetical protein